jgi:hypothetical protein
MLITTVLAALIASIVAFIQPRRPAAVRVRARGRR